MRIAKQDRVRADGVQGMIIEIEDDNTDLVWIYKTIDGEKVEGGSFSFADFLEHVDEFYSRYF